ncbi:MAG: hypothetical protein J5740_00915 [Bacteroidales bacterium]|nr:hypothetical protein [Bacteroidales bacterium]
MSAKDLEKNAQLNELSEEELDQAAGGTGNPLGPGGVKLTGSGPSPVGINPGEGTPTPLTPRTK